MKTNICIEAIRVYPSEDMSTKPQGLYYKVDDFSVEIMLKLNDEDEFFPSLSIPINLTNLDEKSTQFDAIQRELYKIEDLLHEIKTMKTTTRSQRDDIIDIIAVSQKPELIKDLK